MPGKLAIACFEGNEARSVVEAPSGLLGAMHVLFGGDWLSFAHTVTPCFVGGDAFAFIKRVA